MLSKMGNNALISNKNKGYSLLELVITIAVFSIITLLITSMTMYINKFTNERRDSVRLDEEINSAEKYIKSWFFDFNDAYHVLEEVSSNDVDGYFINFDNNDYLFFSDGKLLTESGGENISEFKCKYITNVTFDYSDALGLINCHITAVVAEKENKYDILLYKKV